MNKAAKRKLPYFAVLLLSIVWCALILATPFLLIEKSPLAQPMYSGFSYTCHQLNSRSLCIYPEAGSAVKDCTESPALSPAKTNMVTLGGEIGYKIPVCARDIGIYFAMLAGLAVLPFVRKVENEKIPDKWLLVLALIPIAIDGTGQLLGFWESTNAIRLWTGAVAGFALPFYVVPMANWAAKKAGLV